MAKLTHPAVLIVAGVSCSIILPCRARAQGAPPTASAAFPPEPGAVPGSQSAPPTPPPGPQPAPPPPLPTPPLPTPPVSTTYSGPPSNSPGYAQPPNNPGYAQPPNSPGYAQPATAPGPSGYDGPPPPPQNPDEGFQRPDISIRIDPFNFLLEGRLGLEIESQVYKFLSVEIVPVFVTTGSPPTLNYRTYEKSTLRQASNGIGAISGAALDAGFWFGGKPFHGNVLRIGFTNYAYTYNSTFTGGSDSVSHTDRQFFAMFGSHSNWGAFTLAGGFGLAYELNRENRCFDPIDGSPTTSCDKDTLQIKLGNNSPPGELHPFLYPFDLVARFSLGVVF